MWKYCESMVKFRSLISTSADFKHIIVGRLDDLYEVSIRAGEVQWQDAVTVSNSSNLTVGYVRSNTFGVTDPKICNEKGLVYLVLAIWSSALLYMFGNTDAPYFSYSFEKLSGEIYTWGDGTYKVAHDTYVSHWILRRICGQCHTSLVISSGYLFAYGDENFGVLGHGYRRSVSCTREVESFSGLKTIFGTKGVVGILCASYWSDIREAVIEHDKLLKDDSDEFLSSENTGASFVVYISTLSATSLLYTKYQYVGVFMVSFAVLVFRFLCSVESFSTSYQSCTYSNFKMCKLALANTLSSTIYFIVDVVTSVVSVFLGMKMTTYANARTTSEAWKDVGRNFIVAFRSGTFMGFLMAANGLLVLYILINPFKLYYCDDWEGLFNAITVYDLGGSSMALFGRVGGGTYTKAADIGADLVGNFEKNIPEDDPRKPAIIADNVGDFASMGSDPYVSYAEAYYAALVVASISSFGNNHESTAMLYPLVVSFVGMHVCLITILVANDFFEFEIKSVKKIEPRSKKHLFIFTTQMPVGVAIVSFFGLSLGYKSVIIPIFAIAASIFGSFNFAAMHDIAIDALDMLSIIATCLAIDAYGPIIENSGGIAEMAGMSRRIRERTDALDDARNTSAAIGKGFAIGIVIVDILSPNVFIGLIVMSSLQCKAGIMSVLSTLHVPRSFPFIVPFLLFGNAIYVTKFKAMISGLFKFRSSYEWTVKELGRSSEADLIGMENESEPLVGNSVVQRSSSESGLAREQAGDDEEIGKE